MKLSPVLDSVGAEQTFYYSSKAREVSERKKIRIINLGAGQPDFETPQHIKDEAKRALDAGMTGYTEAAGIPELRRAIAEYLNRAHGAGVSESNILVTPGGKTAIFLALAAVARPGSEVIIPEPSFYSFAQVARLFGAKPVFVPLKWAPGQGFELDPDAIVERMSEKTSAVVLNSPHNPTGAVFDKHSVKKVFDEAASRGVAVVSDEVYEHFVYDGAEFFSVTSIDGWVENAILVHSFSKTFAMTGWRLGFVAAREDVVKKLANLAVAVYSCATSFVQAAGVAALRGSWEHVARVVKDYGERRRRVYEVLKGAPGIEVYLPKGGFYVFANVKEALSKLSVDVSTFAEMLLESKGVLVIPGTVFPDKAGRHFVRISFCVNKSDLEAGLRLVKEFLEEVA